MYEVLWSHHANEKSSAVLLDVPVIIYFIMLCKLVLTFEFVDENVWFYHSNETSLAVLSPGWDQGPTMLLVGKKGNTCHLMPKNQRSKEQKGGRAWGLPLMLTMVSRTDWSNISNVLTFGISFISKCKHGQRFWAFFFFVENASRGTRIMLKNGGDNNTRTFLETFKKLK